MEFGSIERELHVGAPPEVVFEVVSRPEHMREWWPDDARFDPVAGTPGVLVWRDASTGDETTVAVLVVEVDPPSRFSFRWSFTDPDRGGDSLLVTFHLIASAGGTLVRMTETGFREMGWEVAVLEERYEQHARSWDRHLPRLAPHLDRLAQLR